MDMLACTKKNITLSGQGHFSRCTKEYDVCTQMSLSYFFFPLLYLLIQTVEVGAGSGEEEGFDYNIIPVYVYSVITNCYCLTKKLYVASREHWSDYVARCLLSLGPCFFLFFFVGQ